MSTAQLEVRAKNSAAVALYEGLGFTLVGRRKRYYPDSEDALLMNCVLPQILAQPPDALSTKP